MSVFYIVTDAYELSEQISTKEKAIETALDSVRVDNYKSQCVYEVRLLGTARPSSTFTEAEVPKAVVKED